MGAAGLKLGSLASGSVTFPQGPPAYPQCREETLSLCVPITQTMLSSDRAPSKCVLNELNETERKVLSNIQPVGSGSL